MVDEKAKRRPNFDEVNSVPVKLADGQSWYFAKPWIEIHASFRGGKARDTCPILTHGPEIDELVKAIGECDDNSAVLVGAASLGAHLLSTQYDLADEELDQLFAFRPGDDASWGWAAEVMRVATGQPGPKA